MTQPDPSYVKWLEDCAMLKASQARARLYSGQSRLWQQPYAEAQPRRATEIASVWLTVYPDAIIAPPGCSVLGALAHEALWKRLSDIGIQGLHTGPIKLSGGIRGRELTPSVDGNFDRISFDIDPLYGSEQELIQMSRMAAAHNAVTIDDLIPSHTGKGADFRLAELAHGPYPGLYHMVEIREEDWPLLPEVPAGRDAVNLLPAQCDELKARHYIVGQLQRVIFFEPGVKETDWSATAPVTGVDGKTRRWVYLHYFKEGQPSLNWLDPTFAAQQMIIGDALHALDCLGARGLRLDANGFLGVETRANDTAWSESHPLSIVGNQLIGGMIRKAGGFSFQELNLTLDDIAQMSKGGADLSYDFITRPAYQHALLTGDTAFLRLMLKEMHTFGIDPASLIHALQNHDELTVELVHFWTLHAHDMYLYKGQTLPGSILREHIREEIYERLSGEHAPYNLRFVTNGIACTGQPDCRSTGPARPGADRRGRNRTDPESAPAAGHVQRHAAGGGRVVRLGPGRCPALARRRGGRAHARWRHPLDSPGRLRPGRAGHAGRAIGARHAPCTRPVRKPGQPAGKQRLVCLQGEETAGRTPGLWHRHQPPGAGA